jgi:hypothetical protein
MRGVAGEPLQAIPVGQLDVIVGRVRAVPLPTAVNLRLYDGTISALWRRMPALLPARFGTVARTEADVEAIVRPRERTLRRRLRLVRGRAQMIVRIVQGSGLGDRGSDRDSPRSPIPDPRHGGTATCAPVSANRPFPLSIRFAPA